MLLIGVATIGMATTAGPGLAHTPLITCYDNGDGTVECEAGYSDGASSSGQTIRVRQSNQRLILEGVFDKKGTFKFKKPEGGFFVEFIGDAAHLATFDGDDLVK